MNLYALAVAKQEALQKKRDAEGMAHLLCAVAGQTGSCAEKITDLISSYLFTPEEAGMIKIAIRKFKNTD